MPHLNHRFFIRVLGLVLVIYLAGAWSGSYAFAGGITSVRLKFSGGIGFLSDGGGDLELVRSETQPWLSGYPSPYTDTFAWEGLSSVPEWKAEAILAFGSHFGLGLGLSRTVLSSRGDFSLAYEWFQTHEYQSIYGKYSFSFVQHFEASALGFQLNLYYFLPLGRFELYAFAGPGYYLGDLRHEYDDSVFIRFEDRNSYPPSLYIDDIAEQKHISDKATCRRLGFQTGFGLQFQITPHVFLGVESLIRRVNFNDWTGSSSSSSQWTEKIFRQSTRLWTTTTGSEVTEEEGSLWYFVGDVFASFADNVPTLLISHTQPDAIYAHTPRKAEVDFHAVDLMLTLSFRF